MFEDLDERLIKAINEAGFSKPTQVQTETFDLAIQGHDLFVSAETGSGKTVAYLLPLLERLLFCESNKVSALVLVPTRELAQQVLRHAKQMARFTDLKLGLIGGGTDIHKQQDLVRDPPRLMIATPGRLSKLLSLNLIDLREVDTLILDEADRLLDMGFGDEIVAISLHCENRQQTQLYSATLANKALRGLADQLMEDAKFLTLNQSSDVHEAIKQQIVFADDRNHKYKILLWLLTNENFRQCLVFCNSKEQADHVQQFLQSKEILAGVLHGDRDQRQRNLVMSKLRRDEINILIATDLAARGLDIKGMDLIINFEMPRRGELYIHRIGRTGRAGESGLAISLIASEEYNLMAGIERYLKQSFQRRKIKDVIGYYTGPKKLKSSGKAAGSKKKKKKRKIVKRG